MNRQRLFVACFSAATASFLVEQLAAQPALPRALSAFELVQPGQWMLRSREVPAQSTSICVRDVRALMQIQHGGALCNRFVIADEGKSTTVHYTCPGRGHGRTELRVETSKLIQLETQGILNKEPFAVLLEGRRLGECGAVESKPAR